MNLGYFIIIPALAIGWWLGSIRPIHQSYPSPPPSSEKGTISQSLPHLSSFNTTVSEAPTSTVQCREALEDLFTQKNLHPMVRRALQDRIIRAWLEIDPVDALSFAEKQISFGYRDSLGKDLFRVWVDLDPEGAKQAFSVASPALIATCFHSLCADLGKKDPEGTLDFMASRQWVKNGDFSSQSTRNQIYQNWATNDPEAALAHAGTDENALRAAYTGWARIDPMAAWESAWEAADMSKNSGRNHYTLQEIARFVLPSNPDLLEKYPDFKMGHLVRSWVDSDFEGAQKFASSLPEDSPLRVSLEQRIAHSIATSDPERAIALFQKGGGSQESDYTNSGLFRQAFLSLNLRDPNRAEALLRELPEQHRSVALAGILTLEFAADPVSAALRTREFLNDPTTQKHVLPALEEALSWGHGSGNHDLTQIIEALPELRPKVSEYLLEGWVRTAPESAAAFLAEEARHHAELGTSFPKSGMASGIAELSFSRPEFTSNWVATLPPGDFQNQVAGSLATNWARFDRESAEAWIESLPEGVMRSQAQQALTKPVEILSYEEKNALILAKEKQKN